MPGMKHFQEVILIHSDSARFKTSEIWERLKPTNFSGTTKMQLKTVLLNTNL